jgi:excisionase family DNA binding protein
MLEIPKLFTLEEAGEILKVHPDTLKDWIRSGQLPAVKIGRPWRITEETLLGMIKNGFQVEEKRKRGRPKGGSLVGKSQHPKTELTAAEFAELVGSTPGVDCGYPQAPETAAALKDEDEEFNRMQRFSDESRLKRQRANHAKKEGGKDAQD